MTAGFVRTVAGDVDPATLGAVNYHEHFFQVSPLLVGDELDDEERGTAEARLLVGSGFRTVVDATPLGLGRRPEALARLAAAADITVVATTGRHRDAHYSNQPELLDAEVAQLAARFTDDLLVGMPAEDRSPDIATTVRAGVLKAGIDYWSITPPEMRVIEAIGVAHAATGAPVMVHTEYCSAADRVLDLLETAGVASDRVVLAHADRTPDPGLHRAIAARGAFLGYDGPGRYREWPDSVLIASIAELVEAGAGDRILLGADVARASRYVAYGGVPGLAYLGDVFVPRLRDAIGDAGTEQILVSNAAAWLTWR